MIRIAGGAPAIDWGKGLAQNLESGKFFWYTGEQERLVLGDMDFKQLIEAGQLIGFDQESVSLFAG